MSGHLVEPVPIDLSASYTRTSLRAVVEEDRSVCDKFFFKVKKLEAFVSIIAAEVKACANGACSPLRLTRGVILVLIHYSHWYSSYLRARTPSFAHSAPKQNEMK